MVSFVVQLLQLSALKSRMRFFVHNVDSFLGKVLVSELRKSADPGEERSNRCFGTYSSPEAEKAFVKGDSFDPAVVKRGCSREDPKKRQKMETTLQSCKVVVMDLFSCTWDDVKFAMDALKNTEEPVTFILISSVMVWADTKVERAEGEDPSLCDADYLQRSPFPDSKYEQWKEIEDRVMSAFPPDGKVKALVVAGGIIYGAEEGVFHPLFKNAWCGDMDHVILGKGSNRVPTVHARDLARLVRALMDNPDNYPAEQRYFLAVDQPPSAEAKTLPPTQAEIVQGIVDEMCDPYKVPFVAEPSPPVVDPSEELEADALALAEEKEDLRLTMLLNLNVRPSAQMLNPEFNTMPEKHPSGWHCQEGIVKNMKMIADEFCKERKLRAMRVLVAGPPASGKSTLAKSISEHFRIPHHVLPLQNVGDMADTLSKKVCRYRGYVLDAGIAGWPEVDGLYRYVIQEPQAPADDAGDTAGDGADEADEVEPQATKLEEKALDKDIVPSFVINTQAPESVLEGRWINFKGSTTLPLFHQQLEAWKAANGCDYTLTRFFQEVAKVGILNLPIVGRDEDELFESARIYMEQEGRPFNYLPTEEEVSKQVLEWRQKKLEEMGEGLEKERLDQQEQKGPVEDQGKRHAERMRLIAEHEAAQQQLREMPLRDYLMEYMIPNLTEGLIEVCKVLPENPADYLANYLEEHASQEAP